MEKYDEYLVPKTNVIHEVHGSGKENKELVSLQKHLLEHYMN